MRKIEAKEYLQQVRNADMAIKDKMEELARLRTLATSISVANDGERVQSSGSQDKMADTMCKITDFEAEIQAEIDNLLVLKRDVRGVIEKVSEPVLMSVLHKRYLQYKSWEQIAIELDISWRHTLRLHGKALREIEKILNMS